MILLNIHLIKVLGEFKEDVIKFAKSEGLDAHANSVAVRFEEE